MDDGPDPAGERAEHDAVRRALRRLGADHTSAPDVPAHVTARVGAALRNAPPPRAARRRAVLGGGVCVGVALILGVGGILALARGPSSSTPHAAFPLPDTQLRAVLDVPADLGPLASPQRLAACLTGLGYEPTQEVLGARTLRRAGHTDVLLLFPSESAQVRAVIVEGTCRAATPGVLADRTVARR